MSTFRLRNGVSLRSAAPAESGAPYTLRNPKERIMAFADRSLASAPPRRVGLVAWLRATYFALATEKENVVHTPNALTSTSANDFDDFYAAHRQTILSYLWRMTGDEQSAFDLSQETFLRAWQQYDRIRGYQQPLGWLFRVATNLAINHQARRTISGRVISPLDEQRVPTRVHRVQSVATDLTAAYL
jgi:hypothetical protein